MDQGYAGGCSLGPLTVYTGLSVLVQRVPASLNSKKQKGWLLLQSQLSLTIFDYFYYY